MSTLKPTRLFALSNKLSPRSHSKPTSNIQQNLNPKRLQFTLPKLEKSPLKHISKHGLNTLTTPKKIQLMEKGVETFENTKNNLLGCGTFGTVLKCLYKDEIVAVKVVKKNTKTNSSNGLKEKYTISEEHAKTLLSQHPNVLSTLDVIDIHKNYGLVIMEYLENAHDLSQFIHMPKNDISKGKFIEFAKDICAGLEFCHKNSIIHMDLKPKNILLTSKMRCKICDFGNSYMENTHCEFINQGTPAYTAPEIFLGLLPTKKCDIFSFGITLWEMENRQVPYESIENNEILIYKVVKFGLRPNAQTDQNSTSKKNGEEINQNKRQNFLFNQIYTSCWSTNPKDRPLDFCSLHKELSLL